MTRAAAPGRLLAAAWRCGRAVVAALLDAVLDGACAGCGEALSGLVGPSCAACLARLRCGPSRRCRTCSEPLGAPGLESCGPCWRRPPRHVIEAPHLHAGAARRLVHALKYRRRRDVAPLLASSLLTDARARDALSDADVITYVPADPLRRHDRGFDHAEDLAHALGAGLGRRQRPPVRAVLARRRSGPAQASLSATARRRAVAGALRARLGARRCVSGRNVVLVDDVVTTGATAREACRVLRSLGARRITVVACTRAAATRSR